MSESTKAFHALHEFYSPQLTPSKENYLKTILDLSCDEGIRSSSIAECMGVTRASVSSMLNTLKTDGFITKEKYGTVVLTDQGRDEASRVKKRFDLLNMFFNTVLGVVAQTAADDACQIEHLISSKTADMLMRRLEMIIRSCAT